MLAAFHRHQATHKGFGPAAGPAAASILQRMLREHGYSVAAGASVWRLGKENAALISVLADGIAKAVSKTGLVPETTIADWRAARMKATECEIGHIDLFAASPSESIKPLSLARDHEG
jgi:hypothetical protein